jgi:AraC-like DNA-binding protein
MIDLVNEVLASSIMAVARTTPGDASAGPHAIFAPVPALLISLAGERHHRYAAADGTIRSARLADREALLVSAGTWLETTYASANNALSLRSYEGYVRMVYIEARPGREETIHRGHPARVLEFQDEGDRIATVMETLLTPVAPISSTYLGSCAAIVLHELMQALSRPVRHRSASETDATWRMLVTWVEETVGTEARREEAAAALRIHPNHVSRVCRSHGTTYSRLLHRTRIRYARELLASTPLTVSEIAYRCGYSDPPNFHHQFRRLSGCTPSEHRATHQDLLTQ